MPAKVISRRRRRVETKPSVGYGLDPSHPLAPYVAGAWPFNEGGGVQANDLTGRLPGILQGSATWVAGPRGPQLSFDGTTNCYVSLGNPTHLQLTQISVTLRCRATTNDSSYRGIITHVGNWGLYARSGSLVIYDASGGLSIVLYDTWFMDGNEHHVAVVRDSDGSGYTAYADGIQTLTASAVTNPQVNPWEIGRGGVTADTQLFIGTIDDVKIFAGLLSAEDVRQDMIDPGRLFRTPRLRRPLAGAAGGTITGTLAAASGVGSATFAATNTPPAISGILAVVAGPTSATLAATVTPPATTATLAAVSGPAATGLVGMTVSGIGAALAATSGPALPNFAATVTSPAATVTLGASSGPGSTTLSATVTPPATTAILVSASAPAGAMFAGQAVAAGMSAVFTASASQSLVSLAVVAVSAPVLIHHGPLASTLILLRRRRLSVTPEPPTAVGDDHDIISDIRARLEATGEFDGVHLAAAPEDWGRSAGEGAMAIVQVDSWEDTSIWDDFENVVTPRKVAFTITIHVRDGDPETRDRTVDRLSGVVQNAIDGEQLAGIAYPDMTKIRRGRWLKAKPPERIMMLTGEFTYEVDGFGGHDVSE